MKIKHYILLLGLFLILTACKKADVAGVASSVNETGEVSKIKVVAQDANIRSSCSANADTLQTAKQNDTYDVISKVADWYAVQLPDNSIGFIPEKQTKAIVDPSKKTTVETPTGTTTPGTTTPSTSTVKKDTNKTGDTETPNNSATLSEQEQEMVKLVNDARAQNNLPALEVDTELTNVARIKAQDMIDNNYFSHNSPTYGSPFDMMKNFNVQYIKAGENIAGNNSVSAAHEALMNSPGHRANILSSDYTHIGIGIKDGGQYGMMFCQMFISK